MKKIYDNKRDLMTLKVFYKLENLRLTEKMKDKSLLENSIWEEK